MGLSCGMKLCKILLFVFNFIFWILGLAVLGLGIWSRVDGGSWETLLQDSIVLNAANLMIASGVIVTIIGFLGCCGAIKQNQCMLISYAILIFLIFVLEIATGIFAYTKKATVQEELEVNIFKAINSSYGESTKSDQALTKAVDWFQENVNCCGAKEQNDWIKSNWYKKSGQTSKQVPESCCVKKANGCNAGSINFLKLGKKIHSEGCVEASKDFVKEHMWKIGGAALGIGIIQLLGIVFACCLCHAIKEEEKGAVA